MMRAMLLLLACLLSTPSARADDESHGVVERVRRDTIEISNLGPRTVGAPGHVQAQADLERQIRALEERPHVHVWRHSFEVVMPRVLQAELMVDEGAWSGSRRVYPFWPNGVRLNTTPLEGIDGPLMYVGEARAVDIPARGLRGRIAVMEITGGGRWEAVHSAGATAILVLGNPDGDHAHFLAHLSKIPIHVPRYYVPDGAFADALRNGEITRGRLLCRAEWAPAQATNTYVLVTPPDTTSQDDDADRRAVGIVVPVDAMSLIHDLAPGADNAVDTALALEAVRHFADHPPARPLCFIFADAYSIYQRGVREMLAALMVTPRDRRDHATADRRTLDEYEAHEALAERLDRESDPIAAMHDKDYEALHRYVKDEVSREVVTIESELFPLRISLLTVDEHGRPAMQQRVEALAQRRAEFFSAQRLLLTRAEMEPHQRERCALLWRRARERITGQLDYARERIERHRTRNELRLALLEALGTPPDVDYPLSYLLGLDISDAGHTAGPSLLCLLLHINTMGYSREFTQWLDVVGAQEPSPWTPEQRRAVDLSLLRGMEIPEGYMIGNLAAVTSPAASFGLGNMTWATLDALRTKVDTPLDSAENLRWDRLTPQIEATLALLRRLGEHTDFRPTARTVARWNRIEGTIVDQAVGEPVARLPMDNYLTTMSYGGASGGHAYVTPLPHIPGLRRLQWTHTARDGRFDFDALPAIAEHPYVQAIIQSYLLAPDGSPLRAVDIAKDGKGLALHVNPQARQGTPARAIVFNCRESTVLQLFDPRFLLSLPTASLIDTRRGGAPQRSNISLLHGQMSALLEQDTRWQVILRAGATRNRFALLNMMEPDSAHNVSVRDMMRGFRLGERLPRTPTHQSAVDLYRLNERRSRDYRRAGITSEAIDMLRADTKRHLARAEQAVEEDDGEALFSAAANALAGEVRAYQVVRDTANDVIRAAIFLLLALAPFSVVIERLFLASANVYRQIGWTLVIFTAMTAILWSFHPAFRISSQPLMIIMAFGIIFMSLLVISVVYSKFEHGLEELRSGRTDTSGAQTSRGGVLTSAFQLGIANMRKRKTRTLLTGVTVMFITFTLLCFTSTSSYVTQRETDLRNVQAPFTGVLLRQPSHRPMSTHAIQHLQHVVGATHTLAPRYWWVNPFMDQWRIHVHNPATGGRASLQAALGITAQEQHLALRHAGLPNWDRFDEGDGCYLSKRTAETLGAEPGDRVMIAGFDLELLGVYDGDQLDLALRDLDGEGLLPMDYTNMDGDRRHQLLQSDVNLMVTELESGAALEPQSDLPQVSSNAAVLLHGEMLFGSRDYSLRSVAVAAGSHAEAREMAQALGKRLAFPVFYGSGESVHALASTVPLPQGPGAIFIPLLIGAMIIFNTMLGSIAERKREIHIYTSMGLAPLHVGALFLAEGVAYGLMGSIFGYIAGQGLATLFNALGLMGGLTLNYSGTHAISTMLMVMVVVIISSLVPAYMAGKLAVPSQKMTWRVPKPQGDLICDTLPFTVTGQTADGIMYFLYDYLDIHREGNVGNFSADQLRCIQTRIAASEGERPVLGVESTIWLAPYDLGIRQQVRLLVQETDLEDVYELRVEMLRQAGQVGSWHSLNRVFLGDLRRQLLGWRKLKPERMLRYIADAAEMRAANPTGAA